MQSGPTKVKRLMYNEAWTRLVDLTEVSCCSAAPCPSAQVRKYTFNLDLRASGGGEEADAALPSCLNPVPIRQLADAALPSCLNPVLN